MLYYLHLLADQISYFRVFQYITVRIFLAAGTAFLFSLLAGPWFVRRLHALTADTTARYQNDAPALDALGGAAKRKTPTMGGLLIIAAVVIACLLWALPTNLLVWMALATMGVMGLIGFADDYIKTVQRNARGLSAWKKLVLQSLWVLGIVGLLLLLPETRPLARQLMVPFLKTPLIPQMSLLVLAIFVILVIVGSSNAVNLTDGLDGLAIGCTGSVTVAYLVMTYVAGHIHLADYLQVPYIVGSGELAVFCGSLLGASLGFLWFNCFPARIFMGDTGSLALGGALGMVAVLIKQELVLIIVGGIFVVEALSVIMQVGWFKLKGRRIFACAPLHHHFQLKKMPWSETQITVRFWIISLMCALLGVLMLKMR